jgi:hypothetical protein
VLVGLFVYGDYAMFGMAYFIIYLMVIARTLIIHATWRNRVCLIVVYTAVLFVQIVICTLSVFPNGISNYPRRAFGVAILLVPVIVSRYITVDKYAKFYLPSIAETGAIGFSELKNNAAQVGAVIDTAKRTKKGFALTNIKEIVDSLPRHSSFSYVNDGSLTEEFFARANETVDDENIYIAISQTGSAASDIVSVFTNKQYNHASLAFDRELDTVISYNGGGRAYPPGMNPEMLSYFKQKEGASILIYSLPCGRAKKLEIIDKVFEINVNGSAYNLLGLVTKASVKPNIMFCSQFVYKMIDYVGLAYFEKPSGSVTPTDLIELDYHRKLKFEYELKL